MEKDSKRLKSGETLFFNQALEAYEKVFLVYVSSSNMFCLPKAIDYDAAGFCGN